MNSYAIVLLLGQLLDYFVRTASDALNVAALRRHAPDSLAVLYGVEGLARSRSYIRLSTAESICERTVSLAALLAFWLLGGFGWLDLVVRGWFSDALAQGLAYFAVLAVGYGVLSLPFDLYRTFGVEARFGFNRTSVSTFVADRLKGAALVALLGGGLLGALLLLFLHAGGMAWLLCWLAVMAFSLVVQWLGPALILPLFNRFTPMPEGPLRDAIVAYADSVDFPLENVFVIDGSRRSSRANAYFTGLGRRRRIALFDTLIEQHPVEQIVAILAHEVGHYRLRHVAKGLLLGAAEAGLALFLLGVLLRQSGLYEALFVSGNPLHAGLVAFGLLYTPLGTVLSMASGLTSRRHEFAADRFAVDTAPAPQRLVDALTKLSVVNLTHPTPHPFHVWLNYSHPPLARRLEAIEQRLGARESKAGQ
jgi:STE24 endopeptidase